ncbi:MAG: hypothetical protein HUK20_13635 [Fibrobacter sp.]|nr:hypothetical protein [Fibrobacter sp.]
MANNEGYWLKAQYGWNNSGNGIDGVGFSALPSGYRGSYDDFSFGGLGSSAGFWSASEDDSDDASYRHLYSGRSYLGWYGYYESYGLSVRCLQD